MLEETLKFVEYKIFLFQINTKTSIKIEKIMQYVKEHISLQIRNPNNCDIYSN